MEEEVPSAPSPAQPPVMDVMPARNTPDPQPQEQVAVKPEPPPEKTGSEHKAPAAPAKQPANPKAKPPGGPGKPNTDNGVGMAIAATVIIVLGLAALATYAFIKAQN